MGRSSSPRICIRVDLPEPDLANNTILAFSSVNRSKMTRLLLCRLMPYIIPWFEVRSSETNGKNDEIGPVSIGVVTPTLSSLSGNMEKIESWVGSLDRLHATRLLRWLIKENG